MCDFYVKDNDINLTSIIIRQLLVLMFCCFFVCQINHFLFYCFY